MGRDRKPDAVKATTGTLQKCRINHAAPTGSAGFPVAPDYLTDLEREFWYETCQLLSGMNVLKLEDVYLVEEIAVQKADLAELRAFKREHGRWYTPEGGTLEKTRPVAAMEAEGKRHLLTLLGKAGLTPESRSKIAADKADADDDFDDV